MLNTPSALGAPVFSITPNPALTGYSDANGDVNPVDFSYTPTAVDQTEAWDLDGDGAFDDAFGPTARGSYRVRAEKITIGLLVSDSTGSSTGFMDLAVNGPLTGFANFPQTGVAGQQITFVYSPIDPGGSDGFRWDLNGDGRFEDAEGPTAFTTFGVPGTFPVSLRVTDQTTGAVSTGTQLVSVVAPGTPVKLTNVPPKPRLMSPFPVVRITGKVTRKGARIKRLTVRAPYGSTVAVRCRGRSCPFRRSNRTLKLTGSAKAPAKTIRVRKLERRLLRDGSSIKVLVSKPGEIGKYTRFRIRGGKPPVRSDLCLLPGSTVPKECPSS
jgi:hypothetical protein